MSTLRRLPDWPIPTAAVWLLTDIAEAKGRSQLCARQSPQVLKALREMALIQSAESSNRIEGVTVERKRLRPLVIGGARPRDRSEQEVQGYRRALDLVHGPWAKLSVTPQTIRRLHAWCMAGSGDAGRFKKIDNEIVELRPGAAPVVRFRPVAAADTPEAVDELCRAYSANIDQRVVPPLAAAATLVLDFLCIHPFRDGNGRVSRLLGLLTLYGHGHEGGGYISTGGWSRTLATTTTPCCAGAPRTGTRAGTISCPGSCTSSPSSVAPTSNSRVAPAMSAHRGGQRRDSSWTRSIASRHRSRSASWSGDAPVSAVTWSAGCCAT